MHMRVDQPGQDVQARGVDGLVRRRVPRHAECRDAPVADPDIGRLDAPRQHAGAVSDQQVEMRWHGVLPVACASLVRRAGAMNGAAPR
jgi:hypothetical protein